MKVYSVESNEQDFRKLEFIQDYNTSHRLPVMENGELVDWNPPVCRYMDVDLPMADFTMLGSDSIVYDSLKISEGLVPDHEGGYDITTLLEMACFGKLAYVTTEQNKKLNILMVTECNNALDRDKSQWQTDENGNPKIIDKFVFHESRIFSMSGLFRLADPDFDRRYIFAYTSREDEEEKFIDRYIELNKTGLLLKEVWSNEN